MPYQEFWKVLLILLRAGYMNSMSTIRQMLVWWG